MNSPINLPEFLMQDYESFFAWPGEPDLAGILARMQRDFEANNSGVYLARTIEQILETKRLDGCQEWGLLWVNILGKFGVESTYIQGVDSHWLDEYAHEWEGDGWSGHVFIRAFLPEKKVVFCSTSARAATEGMNSNGQYVLADRFVVLFEGTGPEEFNAYDQEGINILLRPLIQKWLEQ